MALVTPCPKRRSDAGLRAATLARKKTTAGVAVVGKLPESNPVHKLSRQDNLACLQKTKWAWLCGVVLFV